MIEEHDGPVRVFTPDDQAVARLLMATLRPLGAAYPGITLVKIFTFLRVCAEEGLSVSMLAARCRLKTHIVSRHLQDLSPRNRRGDKSCGLVMTVDLDLGDRRQRHVYLTDQGRDVARKMFAALNGEPLASLDALGSPAETGGYSEADWSLVIQMLTTGDDACGEGPGESTGAP